MDMLLQIMDQCTNGDVVLGSRGRNYSCNRVTSILYFTQTKLVPSSLKTAISKMTYP